MSEPMIVFDRVSKNYGSMTVLSNINLEVAAGEVISLIGPSGSGKSTLLRCVNHLERIEHGSITVEGELIGYRRDGNFAQELPEKLIARQRARIGMVFQNFNLFGHKTALENVIEAPVHVLGIAKREAEKQAGEVLDVMRSLAADGLTMMVVTHEMSFARDVCNRIAFMQAGKIVECGAPSEILDNPAFERTRSFLSKVH